MDASPLYNNKNNHFMQINLKYQFVFVTKKINFT